ncbi:MAG: hypothetical protein Q4F57_10280, partial [Weeksellaceae bacterium]|nr:hypothetical protein [Weeksellaceae bacterium]
AAVGEQDCSGQREIAPKNIYKNHRHCSFLLHDAVFTHALNNAFCGRLEMLLLQVKSLLKSFIIITIALLLKKHILNG